MSSPEKLPDDWRSNEGNASNGQESPPTDKAGEREFDVFLCHNDADKPAIRWIAANLRRRDILPWLDEDELQPGRPWQDELEKQIEHIKAIAVFVGPKGIGPWQNHEMHALIYEFMERQRPVIPVLLPGAVTPSLPLFLKRLTWVKMRKKDSASIDRLVWGITGQKPSRP